MATIINPQSLVTTPFDYEALTRNAAGMSYSTGIVPSIYITAEAMRQRDMEREREREYIRGLDASGHYRDPLPVHPAEYINPSSILNTNLCREVPLPDVVKDDGITWAGDEDTPINQTSTPAPTPPAPPPHRYDYMGIDIIADHPDRASGGYRVPPIHSSREIELLEDLLRLLRRGEADMVEMSSYARLGGRNEFIFKIQIR